jgi:hypothetical protein
MTNDLARILAQNIRSGSGNHGLSEDDLYLIFKNCNNIDGLAYSLSKCAELTGKDAFSTQLITQDKPVLTNFSTWHHIDEPHSFEWGFNINSPGCYVYGLFPDGPPPGPANFLDKSVFYIGESRAVSRKSMLGRRADFKNGVRNDWVSPMGNSQSFKEKYGQSQIENAYQAYLTMHPSFCKTTEMKLLCEYHRKYKAVPACNPTKDLHIVERLLFEDFTDKLKKQ